VSSKEKVYKTVVHCLHYPHCVQTLHIIAPLFSHVCLSSVVCRFAYPLFHTIPKFRIGAKKIVGYVINFYG